MEIPFLQARYYTAVPLTAPRHVELIVVHCAVVKPQPGMADWLMKYCATNDRQASWTYALDSEAITQSVREEDVAWHAPGTNRRGIGVEFATDGEPTPEQWADSYHQKMLGLGAFLFAGICKRRALPTVFVDAAGLLAGRRGITTHAEATKAFGGSHTDPGPHFPMQSFLEDVAARLISKNYQGG